MKVEVTGEHSHTFTTRRQLLRHMRELHELSMYGTSRLTLNKLKVQHNTMHGKTTTVEDFKKSREERAKRV